MLRQVISPIEPTSATRCSSSGDRLHQSAAAPAAVGIIVIRGVGLEEGIHTESCGTENAADQFQRDTTSTDFDEFTHS